MTNKVLPNYAIVNGGLAINDWMFGSNEQFLLENFEHYGQITQNIVYSQRQTAET